MDNKSKLSVIVPAYNAAEWMEPTLSRLFKSLKKSDFKAEVIVVDDGSTDGTANAVRKYKEMSGDEVHVISQDNQGRYMARKTGVDASRYENILFVDSRVFIDEDSLRFLSRKLQDDNDQIWNGHVNIDKKGNIFARFWDAIVCIAWQRYFRNPREVSYGIKEFDYYPKGTGFFYVPKKRLLEAMEYFETTTNDIEHSSDDTLLIRYLNERANIHIAPSFSCLYHGRSNMKGFMRHAYHRGEFFIDGFLRPGTRFFYPLIFVLVISVALPAFLLLYPGFTYILAVLYALGLMSILITGTVLHVNIFDTFSLAALSAPFALVYLTGLWRGVIRKVAG